MGDEFGGFAVVRRTISEKWPWSIYVPTGDPGWPETAVADFENEAVALLTRDRLNAAVYAFRNGEVRGERERRLMVEEANRNLIEEVGRVTIERDMQSRARAKLTEIYDSSMDSRIRAAEDRVWEAAAKILEAEPDPIGEIPRELEAAGAVAPKALVMATIAATRKCGASALRARRSGA